MPCLMPLRFNSRASLLKFQISRQIHFLKLSTFTYVPNSNLEGFLSLLHNHQSLKQSMQVHCQLITSGFHRYMIDEIGMTICNMLLRQYSQRSFPEDALQLYKRMKETCYVSIPTDSFTFCFLLKACANLSEPDKGRQIHGHIIKAGFQLHVYVQTALINMYSLCKFVSEALRVFNNMPLKNRVMWNVMITGLTKWGEVDLAYVLFEKMPCQNVVAWTGMIDGYTRTKRPREAFVLFSKMMAEGIKPTEITILTIIPTISNMGALELCKCVHSHIQKNHFTADIRVNNSLIDMYAKCGCIGSALHVFEEMAERRNLVSWTSIVSAFAHHGMSKEAINSFRDMLKSGLKPNRVTFLSVLNACSHGGFVNEGLQIFSDMVNEFGITPEVKHYGCLIDMLGRSGRLEDALTTINEMPMENNVIIWRTLLGACSFHGNIEIGERVMAKILELEKGYGGDYVLLSNILAGVGRFDDVEKIRGCMDESNISKFPGSSLIDKKSCI